MKKALLLIASIVICGLTFAKPVTIDRARQVAVNFWKTTDRYVETTETPNFQEISTQLGLRGFYVFNTVDNDGFVIISADDVMIPILGYSTSNGMVGCTTMPANLKNWLNLYTEEYDAVQTYNIEADPETTSEWEALANGTYAPKGNGAKAVSALIQTKWDQESPYYNQCPLDNGARSATGCVATAMAQVMKYWEWPTQGTGSHSYTTYTRHLSCSANFGSTTYDWSNMPVGGLAANGYTNLADSWSTTEKNAVATLMYHCGVSVEMDYTSSDEGSGAYSSAVPDALTSYFGYAPGARLRYKSNYSNDEWIALLKAELDASRPMLYAGESSAGGHSFVCDGYDANNKFHFNWGWSGSGDAFYALTSLNPGGGGIGGGSYNFTSNQEAIIGISSPNGNPVDPNSIPPDLATYETFTINSPVTYGSTITGQCNFVNFGTASYTGYMGVAAYLNNNFIGILKKSNRSTWNQYYGPDLTISCNATAPYGNGTYTAKAVYSYDGTNWYPIETGYNAPISVTFTITGAPTMFTINASPNDANMGSVTGSGSYTSGSSATLTATPKTGYRFVKWQDNVTTNPRTITVTGNANYTAYFATAGGTNGIDDVAESAIRLYPNPTDGILNVEVENLQNVDVIDAVGRTVISQKSGKIDLSRLNNGVYSVRVSANGKTTIKKVVKR